MNIFFFMVFFMMSLQVLSGTCVAGNLYVDFNASSPGNGTSANPFQSLAEALSHVQGNDTVYIKDGIYNLSRDQAERVKIRGFNSISSCGPDDSQQHLKITTDPDTNGVVNLNAVGEFDDASFFQIVNSQCLNFNGKGRISISGKQATFGKDASLVLISSYKNDINDIIIENTEIAHSTGRGVSIRQDIDSRPGNIIIRNNRIHDIFYRALGGFGDTLLFEENELWDCALANENQRFYTGGWPGVIQFSRRFDEVKEFYRYPQNITVKGNRIRNSWGEGIIMGFVSGGLVTGNVISDVFSVYIYLGICRDVVVNSNHLYRDTDTYDRRDKLQSIASGISIAAEKHPWGESQVPILIEHIQIANNLIDNVGKGINYWFDTANKAVTNSYRDIVICHNVLKNLHYTPLYLDTVPGDRIAPGPGLFCNNIVMNRGVEETDTTMIGNYDVWSVSHNNWTGGLPAHLPDRHGHQLPPGFAGPDTAVGASPANFKLISDSANIAAGQSSSVSVDFWGRLRPADQKPDIGLHQFNR